MTIFIEKEYFLWQLQRNKFDRLSLKTTLVALVVLSRYRLNTTNIIEGLNRQYRKVTKTKSVFPSDAALEKMLYLASENVIKKWTQRYRNWDQVLNQLIVLYGERLTNYL